MTPTPSQPQEQPQAIALPEALLSEEVEPSAVAVVSDETHIYMRGFVGHVDDSQFIASRSWKIGAREAIRLGQDLVAAGGQVSARDKLRIVGADQAPSDLRG